MSPILLKIIHFSLAGSSSCLGRGHSNVFLPGPVAFVLFLTFIYFSIVKYILAANLYPQSTDEYEFTHVRSASSAYMMKTEPDSTFEVWITMPKWAAQTFNPVAFSDVNLKIYLVSKPNFLIFIVDAGYFNHFVAAIYGRVGQDASTKNLIDILWYSE
ncbi:hypothetical protein ACJX0J_030280 [Zea mays]